MSIIDSVSCKSQRIIMFLIGCIGTRLALVYLAKHAPTNWLRFMGYLALLPAAGFAYFFLSGSRKTGTETCGQPIWWNSIRPLHSILYFTFAYHAILGDSLNSWKILAVDLAIGILAFLWKHLVI